MDYSELVAFARSMPHIPARELKCHPLVVTYLREETWWLPASRSWLWNYYDSLSRLSAVPVYEDPSMDMGAWEIREDGVVIVSGNVFDG